MVSDIYTELVTELRYNTFNKADFLEFTLQSLISKQRWDYLLLHPFPTWHVEGAVAISSSLQFTNYNGYSKHLNKEGSFSVLAEARSDNTAVILVSPFVVTL